MRLFDVLDIVSAIVSYIGVGAIVFKETFPKRVAYHKSKFRYLKCEDYTAEFIIESTVVAAFWPLVLPAIGVKKAWKYLGKVPTKKFNQWADSIYNPESSLTQDEMNERLLWSS